MACEWLYIYGRIGIERPSYMARFQVLTYVAALKLDLEASGRNFFVTRACDGNHNKARFQGPLRFRVVGI